MKSVLKGVGQFLIIALILLISLAIGIRGFRQISGMSGGGSATGHGNAFGPELGQGARGRIKDVNVSSITIQGRDGSVKTFGITGSTTITLDGQPASAGDLQNARLAAVASDDGATATSIKARTQMKRSGRISAGP